MDIEKLKIAKEIYSQIESIEEVLSLLESKCVFENEIEFETYDRAIKSLDDLIKLNYKNIAMI